MRVRYVGAEAATTTFGRTFHRFEWVSIVAVDASAQATLGGNPQFETEAVIEGEAQSLEPAIEEG